jgi:2,4-dienoyl-CoA reductase-like NADH-dependent reductase (Old Yellow Enzyme family)
MPSRDAHDGSSRPRFQVETTQMLTPLALQFAKPRPMTVKEIDYLVEAFAYAAEVLYKAGADGAQLHAAHGYLLSQVCSPPSSFLLVLAAYLTMYLSRKFLSARVNHRTDDYGGSLENRARIVFRIISAIKERVPMDKFILSMKLNSADFAGGCVSNLFVFGTSVADEHGTQRIRT